MVDEEFSGKTYFMPTPHPSACGCHLLPLEKAFVCLCATTSIKQCRATIVTIVVPQWNGKNPPLRVILSGGRSPESNPEGDRRSGSPIVERTNLGTPLPPLRVILSGGRSPESNPEGDRRSGSPNAERTNLGTPLPPYVSS